MHDETLLLVARERVTASLGLAPTRHDCRVRTRRDRAPALLAVARATRRTLARLGAGLRKAWRASNEMYEVAYEVDHPWEHEGPLRWRGAGRRARLLGNVLDVGPAEDRRC